MLVSASFLRFTDRLLQRKNNFYVRSAYQTKESPFRHFTLVMSKSNHSLKFTHSVALVTKTLIQTKNKSREVMFPHKLHNLLVIIPYPALMLGIIVARGLKIQNVKLKLSFSPFLLLPFYLTNEKGHDRAMLCYKARKEVTRATKEVLSVTRAAGECFSPLLECSRHFLECFIIL